jgi:hypothetical protein
MYPLYYKIDIILGNYVLAFLAFYPPVCMIGFLGGLVSCGVDADGFSCIVVSPLPCSSCIGALFFFLVYTSFLGALPFFYTIVF